MKTAAWRAEIVAWLLGRVQGKRLTEDLDAHRASLVDTPLFWWWVLEGQQHRLLDGSVIGGLERFVRRARQALASFSPRRAELTRPEGEVDWLASAQLAVQGGRRRFVAQVSGVGLSRDEATALRGTCDWLAVGIDAFAGLLDHETTTGLARPLAQLQALGAPLRRRHDPAVRRRWTRVALRSRWPLLREVCATALRAEHEPVELDALPLPQEVPPLFELLCLVRVMRTMVPRPATIRWLASADGNRLRTPGTEARIKRHFGLENVRRAAGLPEALAAAIRRFAVRLPVEADIVLRFEPPRSGFDGILIEVKSGGPQYKQTVMQLQTYRRALGIGRFLVLGVVEHPRQGSITDAQLDWIRAQANATPPRDVWAFTAADDLPAILDAVGLSGEGTRAARPAHAKEAPARRPGSGGREGDRASRWRG